MGIHIEELSAKYVLDVVRGSCLDEDVNPGYKTKLGEVGTKREDLADIFFKLKIPYMKYISDTEIINDYGKNRLSVIAKCYRDRSLRKLSRLGTIKEFINQATVQNLVDIAKYENSQI